MDSQSSVKALIERLSSAGSNMPADGSLQPETRKDLQKTAKELNFALETPLDTFNRLVFLVSTPDAPVRCIKGRY